MAFKLGSISNDINPINLYHFAARLVMLRVRRKNIFVKENSRDSKIFAACQKSMKVHNE